MAPPRSTPKKWLKKNLNCTTKISPSFLRQQEIFIDLCSPNCTLTVERNDCVITAADASTQTDDFYNDRDKIEIIKTFLNIIMDILE